MHVGWITTELLLKLVVKNTLLCIINYSLFIHEPHPPIKYSLTTNKSAKLLLSASLHGATEATTTKHIQVAI